MSSPTNSLSNETRLTPEPLTTCPKCTYALTGLPNAHRCPECGFEYDEYSWVWKATKKRWWRSKLFNVALLVVPAYIVFEKLIVDWSAFIRLEQTPRELLWFVLCVHLLLIGCRWLYFLDERPLLAVSKSGITYRGFGGTQLIKQLHTLAWDNMSGVKQGALLYSDAYWIIKNKGKKIDVRPLVINDEEWEVLKKALLDAKAHYTNQDKTQDK